MRRRVYIEEGEEIDFIFVRTMQAMAGGMYEILHHLGRVRLSSIEMPIDTEYVIQMRARDVTVGGTYEEIMRAKQIARLQREAEDRAERGYTAADPGHERWDGRGRAAADQMWQEILKGVGSYGRPNRKPPGHDTPPGWEPPPSPGFGAGVPPGWKPPPPPPKPGRDTTYMRNGYVDWRGVLGFGFSDRPTLSDVRKRYQEQCRTHHPDRGGKHEDMIKINAAWDAAQKELS